MTSERTEMRRCYTGESYQRARDALAALRPGEPPIPVPAEPVQQQFEARVLAAVLEGQESVNRYPLGIVAVYPASDQVSLVVESEERAAELLFWLLPSHNAENGVIGIPGLRITSRSITSIELRQLGTGAALHLRGLPAASWRRAEQVCIDKWVDPDRVMLCWRSSPKRWTRQERELQEERDSSGAPMARTWPAGAWLGSGLLRRLPLLHAVSTVHTADGYRGVHGTMMRWCLRLSHLPGQRFGAESLAGALSHHEFGLPVELVRFSGEIGERESRGHEFTLRDEARTARLEIRSTPSLPLGLSEETGLMEVLRQRAQAQKRNQLRHGWKLSFSSGTRPRQEEPKGSGPGCPPHFGSRSREPDPNSKPPTGGKPIHPRSTPLIDRDATALRNSGGFTLTSSTIDISALALSFRDHPIATASTELVDSHGGDLEDLACAISESFTPEGEWCRVENDFHTVTMGSAETRLRLREETAAWHADLFHAGWQTHPYQDVPEEHRVHAAAYVDRTHELVVGLLQVSDLREAAGEGGFPVVDQLVRRHLGLLEERYAALDDLHSALTNDTGRLPEWAWTLVRHEAEDLHMAREWVCSAVVTYHHGTAGPRPDMIFGGICYPFSAGAVDLTLPEPFQGQNDRHPEGVVVHADTPPALA
ncbi:hypothetical protein [Streptomyces sp. NPDC059943]|uniref:hypothetical protein n=1 Tax=Streptomyces sp. NPDC059943 TaxID=3347010 RepID=UPI00365CE5C4